MPFVLDASISASWGLADESSTLATLAEARLENDIALVPRIWWYEVRNLLVVNERRQRITSADSAAFLAVLSSYPIQIDATDEEMLEATRGHYLSQSPFARLRAQRRAHFLGQRRGDA